MATFTSTAALNALAWSPSTRARCFAALGAARKKGSNELSSFTLDKPINAAWIPSLAPWRNQRVPLKAEAGEKLYVPDGLAFALAHDLPALGYEVSWLAAPDVDELDDQRAIAQRHTSGPIPTHTITTTRALNQGETA